jgi:predicted nucleotidyltransferase
MYHDKLNLKFWEGFELRQEVASKLLEIGYKWAEFAKIPQESIRDIILVGGNANFNYTRFSDLDLHLVVDKTQIANCPELLDDYLRDKKQLWALMHDIKIYAHPVELYAQDINDPLPAGQGVYSLLNGKWIKEPQKQQVDLTDPLLFKKVHDMMEKIDDLIENQADDPAVLRKLKDRIRDMRASAIQQGGEFALENLVFKELRNRGYLDKLSKHIRDIEDRKLSL